VSVRWAGCETGMGDYKRVLIVIFTGKRPFGTSRYRWEDNIEIYLGDMEYIYIYIYIYI
jgi:hypothetical protein